MSHDPKATAILLVDPYNDFLSEGGKLWPRVKAIAEEVKLLDHLSKIISTARAQGLKIFFVPHHRWKPGDYVSFDNPSRTSSVRPKRRSSPKTVGAARSMMTFSPRFRSTGDRAASPIPISTCSSSSTASAASSW